MLNQFFACSAASAFGLEGAIAAELKRLGMREIKPENGFVRFKGTIEDVFLCNLKLRFSDRVYLIMAEGNCYTFEDLFSMVRSVPWEQYTLGTEAINVTAQCARSRLMSLRACQAVSKKAVLERLKEHTQRRFFPESGSAFPIHIHIHADYARIMLDTSGTSLSRRGYRTWNGEAPLRETLAASLVEFSPWRPGQPLYDPCCGTGTILIEAALRMGHIAPGCRRSFSMEGFSFFPSAQAEAIRVKTLDECEPERVVKISGSDIDADAIRLAEKHLVQSHLADRISLHVLPLQEVLLPETNGVFLCNPPYGERLGDIAECRELYRDLRRLQERHPTWCLCAITSDPGFEKAFGRRADKRRKLFNGRLECQFYTFLPRASSS